MNEMKVRAVASSNAAYLLRSGGQLYICSFAIAIVAVLGGIVWPRVFALGLFLSCSSVLLAVIAVLTIRAGMMEAQAQQAHAPLVQIASALLTFFVMGFLSLLVGLGLTTMRLGWLTVLPGALLLLFALLCGIVALVHSYRLSVS